MSNNATRIEEIIQKRNIKQLVHFTRVENLKSINNSYRYRRKTQQ